MNVITIRYRRFHPSYVIGWAMVGLLVGIALAQIISFPMSWNLLAVLLLLVYAGLRSRKWWAIILVFVAGALLGIMRGTDMKSSLSEYELQRGKEVIVQGYVEEDVQTTDRHMVNFSLNNVKVNDVRLPGSVYVALYEPDDPIRRGDKTVIRGKLGEPFGRYQAALRNGDLYAVSHSSNTLLDLRDAFARAVQQYITEPAASLGLGFVIGQRSALPEDIDENLRVVGLTHIVVASGYNLTILVRFARRSLEGHSKYLAFISALGLMLLFIMISGASPSLVRAGAVTGLSLVAWYYGRRFHPLLLIVYVAAVTAVINPLYEWYDIGWYLSFLAFGGVLLLAPLLSEVIDRYRKKKHESGAFTQVVIETIAAQIVTLPLILAVFGTLPVLSVLSNMLVAPVIPLAMFLTAVTGVTGMFIDSFAQLSGAAATIVLDYVLAVVTVLSRPGWAQIDVQFGTVAMMVCFIAISGGIIMLYKRLKFSYRERSFIE